MWMMFTTRDGDQVMLNMEQAKNISAIDSKQYGVTMPLMNIDGAIVRGDYFHFALVIGAGDYRQ